MKKYSLAVLLTAAGCLTLPASSFAAAATIDGATSIGSAAFSPSKNVTISAAATDTAYAAASSHTQGTEQYATLSSDTKIYYNTVAAGATAAVVTDAVTIPFSTNVK